MINSLLTFGAKSVNPDVLEKTLTTGKNTVSEIEKNCLAKAVIQSTYQSLLIAPRGSGKTHITKVLYHRLKNNDKHLDKYVIAYMTENEVGIANYTDLLVSVLRAFIRYEEPGSAVLQTQIMEASAIRDSNAREIFIKDVLNNFANNRVIILLIENFDKILKALGSTGQGKLRDFIHQYNNLSIIATSQSLIADLQDSRAPFYNFFNIFQLEKLDFDGMLKFLLVIAKTEGDTVLTEEINNPDNKGKLKAIYELTEGNPRLLVTFYSFLKADLKVELSNVFIKVMNNLKPYYEQFINVLPPLQQKIVKYLSLNRRAVRGKEIAQACFIEPNVISKQISLLFERGLIDKNKSGKDVFYELKEPLMRICFEIGEGHDNASKLFVDFLSAYYNKQDIQKQYVRVDAKRETIEMLNIVMEESSVYELKRTIKGLEKEIKINLKNYDALNNMGLAYLEMNNYELAFEYLEQALEIEPDEQTVNINLLSAYIKTNDYKKSQKQFLKILNSTSDHLLTNLLSEEILYYLFKFGSRSYVSSFLMVIVNLLTKQDKTELFWDALPTSLFNVLINIEDYEQERLAYIEEILFNRLGKSQASIISLKMFKVGVSLLKNKDKNAIFELSKEEREVFTESVMVKRENNHQMMKKIG